MKLSEVKELLDIKYQQFNTIDFIKDDPIAIPHQFSKKQDIEIAALLVATIAWGNRKMILKSGEKLLQIMDYQPYDFVANYDIEDSNRLKFVHRTFNSEDLHFFFNALNKIYSEKDSLEAVFKPQKDLPGVKGRIVSFREAMLETPHEHRSAKHLSNPLKKSAAKRLNMFLRWMVRKDENGVDFGIWNSISPAELYLPLDVHTGNVARKLKLLKRKQNDWQALEEVMKKLRKFDPIDPVKYDYSLFGLGVYEGI